MDELAAGAGAEELDGLAAVVDRIRERGVALLVVEHNLRLVRRVADRVVVLAAGATVAEGSVAEVAASGVVQRLISAPSVYKLGSVRRLAFLLAGLALIAAGCGKSSGGDSTGRLVVAVDVPVTGSPYVAQTSATAFGSPRTTSTGAAASASARATTGWR